MLSGQDPPSGADAKSQEAQQAHTQAESATTRNVELILALERMHHRNGQPQEPNTSKDIIQTSVQALTILALGLYGAIRFGQQLYCNILGITPEEIGLTYIASISRAAVVLLAIIAPLTLVVGLAVYAFEVNWSTKFAFFSTMLLLLGAAAFVAAATSILGDFAAELGILATTAFGGAIMLGSGVAAYLQRRSRKGKDPLLTFTPRISKLFRGYRSIVIGIISTAVLIIIAFNVAGYTARSQANEVRNGNSLNLNEGLGILGLRADQVRLTGNIPKDPDVKNKTLMYLGRAEGTIIVYDVHCMRALRIPGEGVTVEVIDSSSPRSTTDCI